MIVQVWWQNPACPSDRKFVDEADHPDADSCTAWARRVLSERAAERPDGWGWELVAVDQPTVSMPTIVESAH